MTREERARAVVIELDGIARDHDAYDYGLPVTNDEVVPQMLAVVTAAIREAELAAISRAREEIASMCDPHGHQYTDAGLTYLAIAARIRGLPT